MGQRYIFKDEIFVYLLRKEWIKDKNWDLIKLEFKRTEDWWELVSPQEVIDIIVGLKYNGRGIRDISWIWNFRNLKVLYLWGNELTSLPPEIWNLKNLEELWLSNNKLTDLPKEITNLTKLERLYLSWNDLWYLSESFGCKDTNKYCDKVIDADWDWKVDTILCIQGDWEHLKLWTE